MTSIGNLIAQITADHSQMRQALGQVKGDLNQMANTAQTASGQTNRSLNSVQQTAMRVGGALVAAFSVQRIYSELRQSTQAFASFERQMLMLENQLKTTGRAADMTAQDLENMAQRIDQATLQSADGVRQAQAILMSFRQVATQDMERILNVAADVAEVMGGTIVSSARQMAIALEDPVRGLQMLRRTGTTFTEEQRHLITTLWQTGRELEAQSMILDVMEAQYGGTARAAAQGLAGAQDNLERVTRKLREEIGQRLAPALLQATNQQVKLTEAAIAWVESDLDDFVRGLNVLLRPTRSLLRDVADSLGTIKERAEKITGIKMPDWWMLLLSPQMVQAIQQLKHFAGLITEVGKGAREYRFEVDQSARHPDLLKQTEDAFDGVGREAKDTTDIIARLNDEYDSYMLSAKMYAELQVWKWYEKTKEELGGTIPILEDLLELKLALVHATHLQIEADAWLIRDQRELTGAQIRAFRELEKLRKDQIDDNLDDVYRAATEMERIIERALDNIQSANADVLREELKTGLSAWTEEVMEVEDDTVQHEDTRPARRLGTDRLISIRPERPTNNGRQDAQTTWKRAALG